MSQSKFMKCGHTANAHTTNKDGKTIEICCLCSGNPDAKIEVPPPDLTGRKACCDHCRKLVDSNFEHLAFFEYRPSKDTDRYYCGCMGWD